MRAFIKVVGNAPDNAKLFSLKYRIFCDLSKTTYQKTTKLIDAIGDTLTNDLKFEKSNHKELKGKTVLKFNDKILIEGNTAFRAVLHSYLNSKFTTNKEKVYCEFTQLEAEFKSIHQGSQLTKAKVENACNNLDSLADKLTLLELCYKKISETHYFRRHALIDRCFLFMKNPLTMSQRKHIGLLKAKMDDLVNEHLLKIADEPTKKEFKWVLENYFELMHHKDRRVNFNSSPDAQANNLHASLRS
ncbi:hypothetical protein RVIR1_04400 [Candidatus Rickettsiella viridis]|uniref:Uncharacterized protein n=1 Tax=Candidatus Rickettsiella viridis TaxID=676208 RepID=A0A2Z5UVG7_9COXI|nr:hypothetical protein [Candidatus Rickettsiella viridis]BBB14953.1 hypothetical protein RVIR1_04400 [Candidatus Rickettsiella viridis]